MSAELRAELNRLGMTSVRSALRNRFYGYARDFGAIAAGASVPLSIRADGDGHLFVCDRLSGIFLDSSGNEVDPDLIRVQITTNKKDGFNEPITLSLLRGTLANPAWFAFGPVVQPGETVKFEVFNNTSATAIADGQIYLEGRLLSV